MILDTIVSHKKTEVAALKRLGLRPPPQPVDPPRGFFRAVTGAAGVALIAEAKKASPSKGVIAPDFDPCAIARSYAEGGARALSVLTDERFFQGRLDYLALARATVTLPVLRKDFIIHPLQLEEARVFGADAVLLIAAILENGQLRDLLDTARGLGLDVLVEVHDEAELERALLAGSPLVGVNNRDLRDFSVSLETTFRLKKMVPPEIPVVSESGIGNRSDIVRLEREGISAALVGETLMRAPDRAAAVRELLGR